MIDSTIPNNREWRSRDAFLNEMLSAPEIARELIVRAAPSAFAHLIDLRATLPTYEHYVEPVDRHRYADMLYTTRFGTRPGYAYVLLEISDQPDTLMPFMMFHHMVSIWHAHLSELRGKALPVILPIALHIGPQPHHLSSHLLDLIDGPKNLAEHILTQPFHVIDARRIWDQDDVTSSAFAALIHPLLSLEAPDFPLDDIVKTYKQSIGENVDHLAASLIRLILETRPDIEESRLASTMEKHISTRTGSLVTTVAQRIEKRGEEKALIKVAFNLLKGGFDREFIAAHTGLSERQIKTLEMRLKRDHDPS